MFGIGSLQNGVRSVRPRTSVPEFPGFESLSVAAGLVITINMAGDIRHC
jgi:hypothetical protein